MRKITLGALTALVVVVMVLSVIPITTGNSTSSSRAAGIKALVCYANSDDSGVTAYLNADSRFIQADMLDVRSTTPSLSTLQNYNVVLTWTNYQYQNKVFFGNNLKDYVDGGGGVVVLTFAHHMSTWNIGGTFQTYNYDPIRPTNSYGSVSGVSIGTIVDPGHPIMQGVSSVTPGFTFYTSAMNAGARPIFYWTSGYIGCAIKEINPGRTVGLNQYPRTDGGAHSNLLIANAAAWAAGGTSGIPTNVVLEPQSLNLDSMGNYVSVKVESFPENPEYSPMDVDGTSVEVGGVGVDLKYGTYNNNRFIGKADRLLVEDSIGAPGAEVEVEINGQLNDGTPFLGTAIIKAT